MSHAEEEEELSEEEIEELRLIAEEEASEIVLESAKQNNTKSALEAIKIASSVIRTDEGNYSALHYSALHGNTIICDALLDKGAHQVMNFAHFINF